MVKREETPETIARAEDARQKIIVNLKTSLSECIKSCEICKTELELTKSRLENALLRVNSKSARASYLRDVRKSLDAVRQSSFNAQEKLTNIEFWNNSEN